MFLRLIFACFCVTVKSTEDRNPATAWGNFVGEERRRTPRYPFIATVEVIQKGAQAGITGRVTELSLYGCFIEMPDPFAKGSELTLKIYANGKYFESQAIAVYANIGQGTGVSFQNLRPHYVGVLKQWLIEAALAKFGKKN